MSEGLKPGADASDAAPAGETIFSVIIPTYNYEKYVGRAIESVLQQDFASVEIIVIDDGSTDDSWKVIQSFGDRVHAIAVANQGAARACLTAFRAARGRYVHFLDADDEMTPDCLSTVARSLAGAPAKIQFPLTPIDAAGTIIDAPFPKYPLRYTRAQMLHEIARNGSYLTGPTSSMLFRADVIAAIDDISYERWIDGVAYLLSPYMGEVVTIDRPLVRYRVHGKNFSGFEAPSPERLAAQRESFIARLQHLSAILQRLQIDAADVPNGEDTAYALERCILERIASGAPIGAGLLFRFLRRLSRMVARPRAKLAMAVWAIGAYLSPGKLREKMLQWRYSPWSRPLFLRAIVSASQQT